MRIGRGGRLAGTALIGLLVLVGGGLVVGWFLAARETERTLDDWMAREARVGRHWSCPGRSVAGFPTAVAVVCRDAQFDGEIAGRRFTGRLGGFRAEAGLLHPRLLQTQLQSPFALKSVDDGGALDLTWARLDVELVGLPDAVAETGLQADNVALKGDVTAWGHLEGAAARVVARVLRRTDRADNAYDLRLSVDGGRVPPLDLLLGGETPTTARLDATFNQLDFAAAGGVADRLELWRKAGGRADIDDLRLTHGGATIGGKGAVSIDGAHRPEGRIDARFGGLEPVLRRFGVDPGLVAATGLLGSLLGGRNAGHPDDGGGLRLPVILSGGRVAIGPVRTSISLPPLY